MALNLEKFLNPILLDVSATVSMVEGAALPVIGGLDSAQVIRVDQATNFTFNWAPSGLLLAGWFNTSQLRFDVFYEMVGSGAAVPPTFVMSTLGAGVVVLTVPPNTITAGLYRIVVRMMVLPPSLLTPTVICGFEEVGLVEYYDI
jgi:hypothetical protein